MLSMVEVKCPHCGTKGQIMLPPLGAIIVGPCPHCNELVVVFCGRVLPLHKETMVNGTVEEKHAHLKEVIVDFIDLRIKLVVNQLTPEVTEGLHDYTSEVDDYEPEVPEGKTECPMKIPMSEVENFIKFDLPRIDNKDYFQKVFYK